MSSDSASLPGWTDSLIRIVSRVLRSPHFKDNLEAILNRLETHSAHHMIRSLLWTDPSVSLLLLKCLPYVLNLSIEAGREFIIHMESIPIKTLGLVYQTAKQKLRIRTWGETTGRTAALVLSILQKDSQFEAHSSLEQEFIEGFSFGYKKTIQQTENFTSSSNTKKLKDSFWWIWIDIFDRAATWMERISEQNPDAVPILTNGLGYLINKHQKLIHTVFIPLVQPLQEILNSSRDP